MPLTDYISFAEFRNYFTEFRSIPDATIEFFLESAQQSVRPSVFVKYTSMASGLMAAHLLATSPFGRPLKLMNADGSTDYLVAFNQILKNVGPVVTVCNIAGLPPYGI